MVTIKQTTSSKEWENLLSKHPESNFLQSYFHGITHKNINKEVFYSGIYQGKKLVGVNLSIVESAKRGKYLTVPGGPILDWNNKKIVSSWIKHIKEIATSNKCIFVRIRPQIVNSQKNRELLKKLGFLTSPMHLTAETTIQLNLDQPLDQILSHMRKNTRYEIRKAEKVGIKIKKSSSPKNINQFYQLQLDTAKRQKFVPFSKKLLTSEFTAFATQKQAYLYTASLNQKILAQALIIHYPTESSYHFGASSLEGRKYPGAYAIQWQAIQDAKERNIPRYNFWGVVEPEQTKHRFYGVSIFKRGFGGDQINYIKAHDLIVNPIKYIPNYIFETLRKKLRHL